MLTYGNHFIGNNYLLSAAEKAKYTLTLLPDYYLTAYGSGYGNGNTLIPPPEAKSASYDIPYQVTFWLPKASLNSDKLTANENEQINLYAESKPYWRISQLQLTNDGTHWSSFPNISPSYTSYTFPITMSSNLSARTVTHINPNLWTASGKFRAVDDFNYTYNNILNRRLHFMCTYSSDNLPPEFITTANDTYYINGGSVVGSSYESIQINNYFNQPSSVPNVVGRYYLSSYFTLKSAPATAAGADIALMQGYYTNPYSSPRAFIGTYGATAASSFIMSSLDNDFDGRIGDVLHGNGNFFMVSANVNGKISNDEGWWSASGPCP